MGNLTILNGQIVMTLNDEDQWVPALSSACCLDCGICGTGTFAGNELKVVIAGGGPVPAPGGPYDCDFLDGTYILQAATTAAEIPFNPPVNTFINTCQWFYVFPEPITIYPGGGSGGVAQNAIGIVVWAGSCPNENSPNFNWHGEVIMNPGIYIPFTSDPVAFDGPVDCGSISPVTLPCVDVTWNFLCWLDGPGGGGPPWPPLTMTISSP